MAAPLKLKQQKIIAVRSKVLISENLPVASVLVDTPVSYLEGIYDYLVPEHLDLTATVGTKVLIEFGKKNTEGLIVGRKSESEEANRLKAIIDLTSPSGLISASVLAHVENCRNHFGGGVWNILKSAVPSRVKREESQYQEILNDKKITESDSTEFKNLIGERDYNQLSSSVKLRWALNFPISIPPNEFLVQLILARAQLTQVLLLVPDEKDLLRILGPLRKYFGDDCIEIGSHLPKNIRYKNYIKANSCHPRVIVSTRSGSFTQLLPDATVIVLSDLDQSYYELHAPGWNTRDVTLLRDKTTSIIFISSSHSLEIIRLINNGSFEAKKYQIRHSIKVITDDRDKSFIPVIKRGIQLGNVLISVAEKGYANLFLCAKCRNTASCECGGKLQIEASKKVPTCYLCRKSHVNWICSYCSGRTPFVISKGIDRTAEEIGMAVPKFPIYISSGKKQIEDLPDGRNMVLATIGSEPDSEFAAIVILDGERVFNRPSLRSEEVAKFAWFSLLNLATLNAEIYLSLANRHPMSQAIMRFDPLSGTSVDLASRQVAKMPPFYRVAVITGEDAEVSKFAANLKNTASRFEITGPVKIDSQLSKLVIRAELEIGPSLVELLDDVTKVQGLKAKKIFTVRFDPFDL